ncbi:hypothetical protein ACFVYT_29960 [Streptomyces sp. NPDC058290]
MTMCGMRWHPGVHAALVPPDGWPSRCTGCWRREAGAQAEREEDE